MNRLITRLLVAFALTAFIGASTSKRPDSSAHRHGVGNLTRGVLNAEDLTPRPLRSSDVSASPPMPALSPRDLAEKIALALRTGVASERDHALHQLLPRLLARDSAIATKFVTDWEPGETRNELIVQLVRQWTETDIGAAVTWASSLSSIDDRTRAVAAAIDQIAQNDPASAIELSLILRSGLRDGTAARRVQLWTEQSPHDAVSWIIAQPDDEERDRLLGRIAYVRAKQEPAEAASLVLRYMADGDTRDEALLAVVHQWALRDPVGAGMWVSQFPRGPLLARARSALETARKQSSF